MSKFIGGGVGELNRDGAYKENIEKKIRCSQMTGFNKWQHVSVVVELIW